MPRVFLCVTILCSSSFISTLSNSSSAYLHCITMARKTTCDHAQGIVLFSHQIVEVAREITRYHNRFLCEINKKENEICPKNGVEDHFLDGHYLVSCSLFCSIGARGSEIERST